MFDKLLCFFFPSKLGISYKVKKKGKHTLGGVASLYLIVPTQNYNRKWLLSNMEHDNETLVEKIRGGFCVTENMQLLYENNLPLIKKFIKPYTAYECEADLLQESYFRLWEAVQRYEMSENVRFMAYARHWILLAVRQYIEKCGSTVRIPNYERQKMLRCKRATGQIKQEQGREPTTAEIAALLGVSLQEVQEIQAYLQGVASLDTPITEDGSLTLADARYTDIRENGTIKEIFLYGKTMAKEQGITIERVHQIKEKGCGN